MRTEGTRKDLDVLVCCKLLDVGVSQLHLAAFLLCCTCLLAEESEWQAIEPDLVVPELVQGKPAAGKRVRVVHSEYKDTNIYHALYLPADWKPGGSWPVIVEYAGNRHPNGDGSVESCKLGYGISGGMGVIWVSMPFVDLKTQANAPKWWGDVDATVGYCKKSVKQVCEEYGGDASRVFIAGFSRGSIACNRIGLHDDEIAKLWRGFICHSHYEGVREWPGSTRQAAMERLKRLGGRPQWISHESCVEPTRDYLEKARADGEFTFVSLPFDDHTDRWVLRDLPERRQLRKWFDRVVHQP